MTEQLAITLMAATIGFVSAVFFCVGNAFNSVDKITLQSTKFWDFSEPLARALSSQRAQYVVGGLLLLVSFSLQIAAALASPTELAPLPRFFHTWPYLVIAILVPTGLISWWGCGVLDRLTTKEVLRRHKAKLESQKT